MKAIALTALLLATVAAPASAQQAVLAATTLQAGQTRITAEIADTRERMANGLMWRRQLAPDAGMLFELGAPQQVCMWMKNTLLPLSVAFIDAGGRVVNVADMLPMTEDMHCSAAPVAYALEMNQGWFARHGVGPGFRLRGQPFGTPVAR